MRRLYALGLASCAREVSVDLPLPDLAAYRSMIVAVDTEHELILHATDLPVGDLEVTIRAVEVAEVSCLLYDEHLDAFQLSAGPVPRSGATEDGLPIPDPSLILGASLDGSRDADWSERTALSPKLSDFRYPPKERPVEGCDAFTFARAPWPGALAFTLLAPLDGDRVLVQTPDRALLEVSPNGATPWSITSTRTYRTGVRGADGAIWLGADDGAIDRVTTSIDTMLAAGPAVTDLASTFTDDPFFLFALDATGSVRQWAGAWTSVVQDPPYRIDALHASTRSVTMYGEGPIYHFGDRTTVSEWPGVTGRTDVERIASLYFDNGDGMLVAFTPEVTLFGKAFGGVWNVAGEEPFVVAGPFVFKMIASLVAFYGARNYLQAHQYVGQIFCPETTIGRITPTSIVALSESAWVVGGYATDASNAEWALAWIGVN